MSYWTSLRARMDQTFTRTFGQPVSYVPADAPSSPYEVVMVLADPARAEGVSPAYYSAWAPANLFLAEPKPGDRVVTADSRELVVFAVHPHALDGDLKPQSFWLSLNLTA